MGVTRIKGLLGESEPFLTNSKASKLRVFDAILNTGSTLFGGYQSTDTMLYSVEVDEDKVTKLEELARATLTPHDDIMIGFDIFKSEKKVIYD